MSDGSFGALLDQIFGCLEFDSEHFCNFDFLMHRNRIRRIRVPWFEYSDPNPELGKHPMSLEASQSSRESSRYPRDSKPLPGGSPPDQVLCLEDTEKILEKIARLRGSLDA